MKPVDQPKDCPKCGLTLRGEYDSRWCQNGCDIFTAVPVGSTFTVRANDSEGQCSTPRVDCVETHISASTGTSQRLNPCHRHGAIPVAVATYIPPKGI